MKHSVFTKQTLQRGPERNDSLKASQHLEAGPRPETSLAAISSHDPQVLFDDMDLTVQSTEHMDQECGCCQQILKNLKETEQKTLQVGYLL